MPVRRPLFAVALVFALGRASAAQEIRGTVHDSATQQPVAGAVVALMNSAGATLARNITDRQGHFAMLVKTGSSRLRAIHIGYKPRDVALSGTMNAMTVVDVDIAPLPTMLQTVRVVAARNCPSGPDAGAAAALLDQAREGVLATEVAAEAKPADMVRLIYERQFDNDNRITSQAVHSLANRSVESFRAVYTAQQFVKYGFQEDSAGYKVFFAPDARTIVDPEFAGGYCFHLTGAAARPRQVGLVFTPAEDLNDRVEIAGTLWADTAKRELRDIEFHYVGLDPAMKRASPGGYIGFHALPNGIVLVDRWSLQLPVVKADTITDYSTTVRKSYHPQETGGRVVSATWPDYAWSAQLGTLDAQLVDPSGKPLSHTWVRLENTDYRARTNAGGAVTIARLLAGPYELSVVDSAFADLPMDIAPVLRFQAVDDSVIRRRVTVKAPLDAVIRGFCPRGLKPGQTSVLVGRLRSADSTESLVRGVVTAEWNAAGGAPDQQTDAPKLQVLSTTSDSGVFAFCGLPAGSAISLSAMHGADSTRKVTVEIPRLRSLLRKDLYIRP